MGAHPGREAAVPLEVGLQRLGIDALRAGFVTEPARSLNSPAHSRSRSISAWAAGWRSAE
ncbi:MAG TPA: hypothetical protein VK570_08335 [Rubrivivax sp.]|nr:hypothetical protein [Rubrivivax sp.]